MFAATVFLWPHGDGSPEVPAVFPAHVVVEERRAARPPRGPFPSRRRAERLLRSIEAVWRPLFAQADDEYEAVSLELVYDSVDDVCETDEPWAGLYCIDDRTIHLDAEMSGRQWAYVLAHEVGHHVQELRGVFDATGGEFVWHPRTSSDVSRRQELQAECFAGIWAYATRAPLPPRSFFEEDIGSPEDHERWFRRGWRSGRPARCDPFAERR